LQYAFDLTKTGDVAESTANRVKEFLDEKQLVVLASTVALANFTNRFNHGLGIQAP
jgi:alkylhydroperoxidase family enzyme